MASTFACIVQPKVIEFNVSDQKLHRARKDEELRSELDALQLPPTQGAAAAPSQGVEAIPLCQPGGGCRLLSRSASVSVAAVGSAVCVFEGALINAAALAEDYAPLPEDEPTPEPAALSSAQLICHMYAKVGVEMLGLLRGTFTFVLYESKTSRVLAARDGSGRTPLFQARTARGSLLLSNSEELLEASGATDRLQFLPGDYKYGWSAIPRRYQPADHARLSRRSLDLPASAHYHLNHHGLNGHFHGHSSGQSGSRNGSRRTSLDHHETATATAPATAAVVVAGAGAGAGGGGWATGAGSARQPHRGQPQSQQPPAAGTAGSPPQPQTHPHRTYAVIADDPRVLKPSPGAGVGVGARQPDQAATATAAAKSPNGAWTAEATPPANGARPKGKDKGAVQAQVQEQEGGSGNGRGGSARGASAGHHNHNRRRSMDNHGAWRLGSGPGVAAANRLLPTAAELQEQPQQQQDGAKQQQDQKQPHGAPSGGMSRGRPSLDGRPSSKQHQKQGAAAGKQGTTPAEATARRTSGAGGAGAGGRALRVDAPEFVCTQAVVRAGSAAPQVSPAVVSAP